jgi:hypothetical protein
MTWLNLPRLSLLIPAHLENLQRQGFPLSPEQKYRLLPTPIFNPHIQSSALSHVCHAHIIAN